MMWMNPWVLYQGYLFYLWVPLFIVFSITCAWLSVKNNLVGGVWFWVLAASNIIPFWAFVSRYSKNLFLDALIYDFILLVCYTLGLLYFSETRLTNYQIAAVVIYFFAFFVFKMGS
jgi:hypothetical protein